jgi:hypothetical protein
MDQDGKQQLLDLIEDILINRGYRNLTMDDIAEAAKMSKKTLYVIHRNYAILKMRLPVPATIKPGIFESHI